MGLARRHEAQISSQRGLLRRLPVAQLRWGARAVPPTRPRGQGTLGGHGPPQHSFRHTPVSNVLAAASDQGEGLRPTQAPRLCQVLRLSLDDPGGLYVGYVFFAPEAGGGGGDGARLQGLARRSEIEAWPDGAR